MHRRTQWRSAVTRFLAATSLTIVACMAAFVGWGTACTALFYPSTLVAFVASEWAATEGQHLNKEHP